MTWRRHDLWKVIEQIPIGVAVTLSEGTIEYANPWFCRLLELSAEHMVGAQLNRFRSGNGAFPEQAVGQRLHAGESWQGETQFRTASNGVCHILELMCPLCDKAGNVIRVIHVLQDIGTLKLTETLNKMAFYDNLTGLPNRNLFGDRLSKAMDAARRDGGGLTLLYVDIDHFKRINDTLGHAAGDELLRLTAARLQGCLRKTDTVARLGGDEFAVILEKVSNTPNVIRLAEKLLATCNDNYELLGNSRRITLSIGVSLYPRDATDMDALLTCADMAMYQAKSAGRNGFRLFEHPPGKERIT